MSQMVREGLSQDITFTKIPTCTGFGAEGITSAGWERCGIELAEGHSNLSLGTEGLEFLARWSKKVPNLCLKGSGRGKYQGPYSNLQKGKWGAIVNVRG